MEIKIIKVQTRLTQPGRNGRPERGVIYFMTEESLIENIVHRRNRPYETYKTKLDEVLAKAQKDPAFPQGLKATDFKWSQRAGCSCGCSPGFIRKAGSLSHNVFADYKTV